MLPFKKIAIFDSRKILGKKIPETFDEPLRRKCLKWAMDAVANGADAYLFRIDHFSSGQAEQLYKVITKGCAKRKVTFLLNTLNEEFAFPCDGHHFQSRQSFFPPLNKDGKIYGKSCHSLEEAGIAELAGFDFIFLSPIFRTSSHPYAEPLGLETLSKIRRVVKIPIFATGGINAQNELACLQSGADGIAAVDMFLNQDA